MPALVKLWREYGLAETLAESAAHFLGHGDFPRVAQAAAVIVRELDRELDQDGTVEAERLLTLARFTRDAAAANDVVTARQALSALRRDLARCRRDPPSRCTWPRPPGEPGRRP